MIIRDVVSIEFLDSDPNMDGYDFSSLNAVDSCVFKGIVTNVLGKKFTDATQRNMALECGDLCHKCYAMMRAISTNDETIKLKYLKQAVNTATDEVLSELNEKSKEQLTPVSKYMVYVDYILQNSGYYDEETDKKRTLANIRNSLLAYCSNFIELVAEEPVYVKDDIVGIELPFDKLVKIKFINESFKEEEKSFRFIGKIDGIHVKEGKLILHENKTSSRLDDSWLHQWEVSHQITGYCLIASYLSNEVCSQARVIGNQIPIPKLSGYAYRTERVDRDDFTWINWARWAINVIDLIEKYKNNPELAPMSTKTCSAYYSSCPLIPLCVLNDKEKVEALNEMITDKWSPLDE